jgi:GNAT superfamily N-acetyltransferase
MTGEVPILRHDPADIDTVWALLDLENTANVADDPAAPPWGAGPFRARLTLGPEHGGAGETWYAPDEAAGAIIGWYRLQLPDLENRDRAMLNLVVHPARRRRGLGTALLRHAAGRAAANDRAFLDSFVPQGTAADAFARWAGATYGLTDQRRTLDLATLPPGRLAQVREAAAKAATDYSLVSWAGRTPDEYLTSVAAMYTAMNDAPARPGAEPDIWDEQRVRDRADARLEATGARGYQVVALSQASGEMAALTELRVDPDRPEWGWQGNTVVIRPHRGHRLGLLVKAAMLQWLADAEPRLRKVATYNAASNRHMIAINEELGFEVSGPPHLEAELAVTRWLGG